MSKIKVVQIVRSALLLALLACVTGIYSRNMGLPSNTPPGVATQYDFDGDHKADISVFRPSSGVWWIRRSGDGIDSAVSFGLSQDRIVPGDYDGDLRTDYGVFRNGIWYRLRSLTSTVDVAHFGLSTDIPVPSDFDGDGLADLAVFRSQNGTWHILKSGNGQYVSLQWGINSDIPISGDYDADGKSDFSVFRPSEGNWYRVNSSNGSSSAYQFGLSSDIPLAGDFDGDLRFDLAVWRPSNGGWYIQRSSDNNYSFIAFGLPTDIPVPADYNGDGLADIAVYRPSNSVWHRINSGANTYESAQFGLGNDIPVPLPNRSMSNPTPTPTPTPLPTTMTINAGTSPQNATVNSTFTNPLSVSLRDASNNPVPSVNVTFTAPGSGASGRFSNNSSTITVATNTSGIASAPYSANATAGGPYTVTAAAAGLTTVNFLLTNTPPPTPTPTPTGNVVYAAPNGQPSGTGTITNPFDLQTVLNQPATVQPGTTIYLRGGTYSGRFTSTLTGSVANPVTVRSYPGEWARIDGYKLTSTTTALTNTSSTSTLSLSSPSQIAAGTVLQVDSEDMYVTNTVSGQITAMRGWNGTQVAAHNIGAPVWLKGNTMTINGSDTIYQDFEVLDSNPNRSFASLGDASGRKGGEGFFVHGPRTKFINLVVHDTQDGFFLAEGARDLEIYGVITYNNGHVDPNRGNGHGLYIQNNLGFKRIKNVISFNNYATGMKAFGETGYANNVHFEGVVSFNNSSPAGFPGNPAGYSTNHRFVGLHVGTAVNPPQNVTITGNYLYQPANANTEEGNLRVGYISQGGQNLSVTNNYIMGGDVGLDILGFNNAVVTGNHIFSNFSLVNLKDLGSSTYQWDNNHYYDIGAIAAGNVPYSYGYNAYTNRFGGGRLTYDDAGTALGKGWKQWTGFDANSTYVRTRPTGQQIFVRPNQYQSGRATVIIYNWGLVPNASVNLTSTGLLPGQRFEIRNVQNFFAAPVIGNQTFTSGMSVNLSLTNLTVATPIGASFTPSSTCPEFCVFEVLPLPN